MAHDEGKGEMSFLTNFRAQHHEAGNNKFVSTLMFINVTVSLQKRDLILKLEVLRTWAGEQLCVQNGGGRQY